MTLELIPGDAIHNIIKGRKDVKGIVIKDTEENILYVPVIKTLTEQTMKTVLDYWPDNAIITNCNNPDFTKTLIEKNFMEVIVNDPVHGIEVVYAKRCMLGKIKNIIHIDDINSLYYSEMEVDLYGQC